MNKHTLIRVLAAGLVLTGCSDKAPESADSAKAVDLIVVNANGYTAARDASIGRFSTLVIDAGKVVATGGTALADRYTADDVLDLAGKTLLPGMIDAHGHVSSLGRLRQSLDLAGIDSLDNTLAAIGDYANTLVDGEWVLGRGWNQVLWEGKAFPNATDIDRVVPDRPVFLNRIDGHAAWANTRALELAGINSDTPDPSGGKILRDEAGLATGVLIDSAMKLVAAVVPPETEARQTANLATAMAELASLGVTGVHDAGVTSLEVRLYQALADAGDMPIRVSAMLGGDGVMAEFDAPIVGYADDLFEVTSVKLYADGALGSRGAAMLEPYTDDPDNHGLLFATSEEIGESIRVAHSKGFAANIHAIGDAANRAVLDAFDEINGGKPSGLNDRIEHAQVIALEDIPRFRELGIVASVQPTHATSDMNMAEDRVGSERIAGAYAWRRLLDAGAAIAAGSDFPVEQPEMFDGVYAAVTRKDKAGSPPGGWYPDQSLTRAETLAAFTIWAADSVGQGDRLGNLSPGHWADFIVIDADYFTTSAENLWQIGVLETWVAGRPVYKHESNNDAD